MAVSSWFGTLTGVFGFAVMLIGLLAISARRTASAGPVETSRCRACGKPIAREGQQPWRDRRGRDTCDGFPHEAIAAPLETPVESAGAEPVNGSEPDIDTARCEYCHDAITRSRYGLWLNAGGEAGCGDLRVHRPAR